MRPIKFITLATWMVEHLTFGPRNEALSGDLLEELQLGRSVAWYWRQVLIAIAIGASNLASEVALPAVFAVAWTMLYPAWRFAGGDIFSFVVSDPWNAHSWPSSALLEVGFGVIPAVTFVWAGFLVYLLCRRELIRELLPIQLVQALSTSLTVLLAVTLAMVKHLRDPNVDLILVTRPDFYARIHFFNVSIPLCFSLLAALLFTLSHRPRARRREHRLHKPTFPQTDPML
jgi:hypothetical protein